MSLQSAAVTTPPRRPGRGFAGVWSDHAAFDHLETRGGAERINRLGEGRSRPLRRAKPSHRRCTERAAQFESARTRETTMIDQRRQHAAATFTGGAQLPLPWVTPRSTRCTCLRLCSMKPRGTALSTAQGNRQRLSEAVQLSLQAMACRRRWDVDAGAHFSREGSERREAHVKRPAAIFSRPNTCQGTAEAAGQAGGLLRDSA